jgi:hypothetical protein
MAHLKLNTDQWLQLGKKLGYIKESQKGGSFVFSLPADFDLDREDLLDTLGEAEDTSDLDIIFREEEKKKKKKHPWKDSKTHKGPCDDVHPGKTHEEWAEWVGDDEKEIKDEEIEEIVEIEDGTYANSAKTIKTARHLEYFKDLADMLKSWEDKDHPYYKGLQKYLIGAGEDMLLEALEKSALD